MNIMIASGTFLLAAISAGTMGYAIQRGATCTVAAVGEIVEHGSTKRIVALAETSLWVAGGLTLALVFGFLPMLPQGYPLGWLTIFGGMLLGIGAFTNGACVFGAIARFGTGDWAYAFTPLGFYIGLTLLAPNMGLRLPHALPTAALHPSSLRVLGLVFVAFALWRGYTIFAQKTSESSRLQRLWQPHEATILIGITFIALLLSVGAWTYTDVLFDLAQHKMARIGWRLALFGALLLGAVIGGLTAGRFKLPPLQLRAPVQCLVGGALMGCGSWLIPGGNDWLILVGMPLLWPYAWAGIATTCLTIYLAILIKQKLAIRDIV